MSKRSLFVFVFNDIGKSVSRQDPRNNVSRLGQVSLYEVLGRSPGFLQSLVVDGAGQLPAFPMQEGGQIWKLLTTATVLTILEDAGCPFHCVPQSHLEEATVEGAPPDDEVLAVGISTTFIYDVTTVNRLVAQARRQWPGAPVVLGGAGITLNPGWFEATTADFLVFGDAEDALPRLLEALRSRGDVAAIPNLFWRDRSGQVLRTPRAEDFDLETVPTPRWDLFADRRWPGIVWYESLRGCPFACKFCSYPDQSPTWRTKSAQRMADDFCYYADKGARRIICLDSTMLTPMARMRTFARILIERGTPILWGCWGHPAQLQSQEFVDLLYQAGCRRITMGVESGDEGVLLNMDKHITGEKAHAAVRHVKTAGIFVSTNFMIGFPGETLETTENTFRFIAEAEPDSYALQAFQVRDRTMPILREADRYQLRVIENASGEAERWTHATMTSEEAIQLVKAYETRIALSDIRSPSLHSVISMQLSPHLYFGRSDEVKTILKEVERAFLYHPDTSFGDVTRSESAYEEHRQRARTLLADALSRGALQADPGYRPLAGDGPLGAVQTLQD